MLTVATPYDVSVYDNGSAALEPLALGGLPPHVLVLDCHMPDMSGAEVRIPTDALRMRRNALSRSVR